MTGTLTIARIQGWVEAGVDRVGEFFADGNLLDHATFTQITGAPQSLYITHAQVTHYIRTSWAPHRTEPPQHELVHLLYYMGKGKHLVKWLTTGLRTHASISLAALKTQWEGDVGKEISDDTWTKIL